MNLKERFGVEGMQKAVIFPHARHQAAVECTECHHDMKGGQLKLEIMKLTGMGNDFHMKLCWSCHETMEVPKGKSCKTCHVVV